MQLFTSAAINRAVRVCCSNFPLIGEVTKRPYEDTGENKNQRTATAYNAPVTDVRALLGGQSISHQSKALRMPYGDIAILEDDHSDTT